MIKGILFDKDGTLIDFNEVWGTAVGPVMDRLLADCHMGERELLKENFWNDWESMGTGSIQKEHLRG